MQQSIALVGLPGSGKSTIGRQLARQWSLPFVDTDQVIEARLGCSIRAYFEREGEAAFRDLEQEVLAEQCQSTDIRVIATGGGIVLRPANREVLHAHTRVYYLKALPEEIAWRLRTDASRPLLQGADPAQRLRELLQQREPLYLSAAHFVIQTAGLSTAQVAHRVAMQAELA